jgi:hypothetical protein
MAGAIQLTDAEMALFERMKRDEMTAFLTELDEHGWVMARAVLAELARRSPPKQKPTEESNEWR